MHNNSNAVDGREILLLRSGISVAADLSRFGKGEAIVDGAEMGDRQVIL
ncbi:hypothetical protein HC928_07650 [bacterium]|nr:hypothetical protein [bacterium]